MMAWWHMLYDDMMTWWHDDMWWNDDKPADGVPAELDGVTGCEAAHCHDLQILNIKYYTTAVATILKFS